jgi:hypothetical protein
VPELASFFGMNRATVRFWIQRFNVHRPGGCTMSPAVDDHVRLVRRCWRR